MLTIHRLQKSDDASFALYPLFRRRVISFAVRDRAIHEDDAEVCAADLDARFITSAPTTGYWLITEESGFTLRAVGHLAAWVEQRYGRPYVLVFQAEVDEHHGRETLPQVYDQICTWAEGLNAQIRKNNPGNSKLIDHIEAWTEWDVKAWNRLLPRLKPERVFSMMLIPVGQQPTNPAHTNGKLEILSGGTTKPTDSV